VNHEYRLLLRRFRRDKPSLRSAHCFADRFGIVRIALAPRAIGDDVVWRHEFDRMTELHELPAPAVGAPAHLDPNLAGWQFCKNSVIIVRFSCLRNQGRSCPSTRHLKDMLRDVQADSHNRRNDRHVDISRFVTDAVPTP